MSRPLKIIELGLEAVVVKAREEGRTVEQIIMRCNQHLARKGDPKIDPPTVSTSAVNRFLKTIDAAATVPAHTPELAEHVAVQAIDVAQDFRLLHGKLKTWLEEADASGEVHDGVFWDDQAKEFLNARRAAEAEELAEMHGMEPPRIVQVFTANWQARTTVAREFREALKLWADLLERIHNAEQIRIFQETVLAAVERADPQTAKAIRDELFAVQSVRRAALLGIAA